MSIALLLSLCTTHGTPLFEMRERSEVDRPEVTTKIFESGAWTVETDGNVDHGCFDRSELRAIRRAVQHAPFKIVSSPIACFAYDPNFTEYLVNGRLRFTERMCSGKTADHDTQEALAFVKQDLATAKQVAATPLFEIHKTSKTASVSESTTTIYESGAWTFQPDSTGAVIKGQFEKRTTASIKQLVNKSPWDTSYLKRVCMAESLTSTEYYVHGTLEYTAKLCGAQRLDEKSLGAIKIIERELAKVLPSTSPRLRVNDAAARHLDEASTRIAD